MGVGARVGVVATSLYRPGSSGSAPPTATAICGYGSINSGFVSQLARRAFDPRHALSPPRPGTCRSYDCEARKGNENSQMTVQMVHDVLVVDTKKMKRINGGRTRTRTLDPLIKSQLLYQLSYAPGLPPREVPAWARLL